MGRRLDGCEPSARGGLALASLVEDAPQERVLLDCALHAAEGEGRRHNRPTLWSRCGEVAIERHSHVGPIALVGLVSDSEIELHHAVIDSAAQKFPEMCATRTEPRQLAILVA